MPCREHLSQLRQYVHAFEDRHTAVAVVTFRPGPVGSAYARETELEWPLLIDEDRSLYKAYGMERESGWTVWGPQTWPGYLKLVLQGRKLQRPSGDIHQMGGDVLIDPQNIVRLHYVSRNPVDRPSVAAILQVIDRS